MNLASSNSQHYSEGTSFLRKESGHTSVDLTKTMHGALEQYDIRNTNIILRFDHLPQVFLTEEQAFTLCYSLLKMIFQVQMENKLFLYIKCEEQDDPEVINLSKEKNFSICFHTNFNYNEQWQERNAATLQQCEAIITQNGGSFEVNRVAGTGCLFMVTLPGKPS